MVLVVAQHSLPLHLEQDLMSYFPFLGKHKHGQNTPVFVQISILWKLCEYMSYYSDFPDEQQQEWINEAEQDTATLWLIL